MGKKKNFVLDTNVILHDAKSIHNFQENDIYIPIVVIEELDRFKKGNEQINYNAREFVRELDALVDDDLYIKGTSLGKDKGRLFIPVGDDRHPKVTQIFQENIPDHRILSETLYLTEKDSKTPTILVTKDANLRMKARALGIATEDYLTDKVLSPDVFDRDVNEYSDISTEFIDAIYSSKEGVPASEFVHYKELEGNEYFVINSVNSSALAHYDPFSDRIRRVNKQKCFGIEPRNAEQTFAMAALLDPNIKLVGITGKAGTGKTLIALAAALTQSTVYKQIMLARPIVALANKDLGFLPGNANDKVAPYMQPLFDNLTVIRHQFPITAPEVKKLEEMQSSGLLVIEALAFIRGRSLSETLCIIDEAQNLTPHEIKTIVTRAGEGTKVVFTGDVQQIDSPYLDAQSNGLAYMINKMKGQALFAHVNLIKGERSELSELASQLL